jgi:hypothetical protein
MPLTNLLLIFVTINHFWYNLLTHCSTLYSELSKRVISKLLSMELLKWHMTIYGNGVFLNLWATTYSRLKCLRNETKLLETATCYEIQYALHVMKFNMHYMLWNSSFFGHDSISRALFDFSHIQSLFHNNTINRYSIGTYTEGLKKNTDGSLDIYLQHESPAKDKESNWLPTPKDSFNLILRMYLPEEQVINGTWHYPTVQHNG